MYSRATYLIHYGIKGQKHGFRRFQNEDGTLTEEGKRRYGYYDRLTTRQKKIFEQKMSDKQRDAVTKKMAEGKSWTRATHEMTQEYQKKVGAVVGLGVAAGMIMSNPITRSFYKNAGKALFKAIKNTNAIQKGKLYMQQFMKRRDLVKKGAVVLKKSAYSVRDIPFGGYLPK